MDYLECYSQLKDVTVMYSTVKLIVGGLCEFLKRKHFNVTTEIRLKLHFNA